MSNHNHSSCKIHSFLIGLSSSTLLTWNLSFAQHSQWSYLFQRQVKSNPSPCSICYIILRKCQFFILTYIGWLSVTTIYFSKPISHHFFCMAYISSNWLFLDLSSNISSFSTAEFFHISPSSLNVLSLDVHIIQI